MRFLYGDPYALRGAVEQLLDQPVATRRERDVPETDRDFAVREIPRGSFSRTLALPGECDIEPARASFENGILRVVIPRAHQRVAHTIQVEIAKENRDRSKIVMERPDVVDAVKGEGYREMPDRASKKKSRSK